MRFLEVLCEGTSDVPAVHAVLTQRFNLIEEQNFRIHPHRGKGRLPSSKQLLKAPERGRDQLLDLLPIKLKNIGRQSVHGYEVAVVVLVDADDDDCRVLKQNLLDMYSALPTKPARCLFRIVVEETESWFIAQPEAVRAAYPTADKAALADIPPDAVCGAWERLAKCLGRDPTTCTGGDKTEWAIAIAPKLDFRTPRSPSLAAFITGVSRLLAQDSPELPFTTHAQRLPGRVPETR
ncbi:MAG: DUF4276 family protein [Phycisphaeraceae bacterium]|nr:DUF4276 family protein [Phycisphaeraceae bacterium]